MQKNKTQEELARMLDISLRSYQNIESNKQIPNVITALKLAKLLNITVEKLYILD
jgi:putative transcriptional regulator